MEKKLYDGLMLDVVDLDAEDVIATSGQDCPTQAQDCPCEAQKAAECSTWQHG